MEQWRGVLSKYFNTYFNSFKDLTEDQNRNFNIKRGHSFRVAELSKTLAEKLEMDIDEVRTAYFIGLFHDIGRFRQLIDFNTFNDSKSVDHAEYSAEIVKEKIIGDVTNLDEELVLIAIRNHNKFKLPDSLSKQELQFSSLIRDVDKLDILKVLTEYYSTKNSIPNHTLTWELPKGTSVSKTVVKEILSEKLVSKINVISEIDVKVMQMSWVYDLNFRASFEYLMQNRFLESIYSTLPKNDTIIEINRKVKMFVENRFMNKN